MTAVEAECIHGLEDPAWCSICRHGPQQGPPPAEPGARILARMPGDCTCGERIVPGQEITRWSDGRWRHDGCEP